MYWIHRYMQVQKTITFVATCMYDTAGNYIYLFFIQGAYDSLYISL